MKRATMVLSHIAAAITLAGATFAARAGNGEALDFDPPSMHMSSAQAAPAAVEATLPGESSGPLTRADVKASLQVARAARTLGMQGEIGDSEEVVAHRQAFNELQAEVLQARYAAAAQTQGQLQEQVADATPAAEAAGEMPTADTTVVVTPDMTVRELFALMGEGEQPVTVVMVEEADVD